MTDKQKEKEHIEETVDGLINSLKDTIAVLKEIKSEQNKWIL